MVDWKGRASGRQYLEPREQQIIPGYPRLRLAGKRWGLQIPWWRQGWAQTWLAGKKMVAISHKQPVELWECRDREITIFVLYMSKKILWTMDKNYVITCGLLIFLPALGRHLCLCKDGFLFFHTRGFFVTHTTE
jgi:hypothetical protein